MTDKPGREDVLRVAGEPVGTLCDDGGSVYAFFKQFEAEGLAAFIYETGPLEVTHLYTEAQALAMYAAGAEDMRERAAEACHHLTTGGFSTEDEMECVVRTLGVANTAIRALPITPTNTEGEQA